LIEQSLYLCICDTPGKSTCKFIAFYSQVGVLSHCDILQNSALNPSGKSAVKICIVRSQFSLIYINQLTVFYNRSHITCGNQFFQIKQATIHQYVQ